MGKYDSLAAFLATLPNDQFEVQLTFGRIDSYVGGLPPSSRRLRTWWANNSQGQSLAWNRVGWHVRSVDLAGSTVVFARGKVGGSYAARGPTSTASTNAIHREANAGFSDPSPPAAAPMQVGGVDAGVIFTWDRLGIVALDHTGKLAFPGPVPVSPGIYRFTLVNQGGRGRIYVGESDNLRRRLNTNYRNPGPRQQTSLRVNKLLTEHLLLGSEVFVDVSVAATLRIRGSADTDLDLGRKAGRLFAESAALVLAQLSNKDDIENLG